MTKSEVIAELGKQFRVPTIAGYDAGCLNHSRLAKHVSFVVGDAANRERDGYHIVVFDENAASVVVGALHAAEAFNNFCSNT